jgi:hypothetical protein
VYRQDAISGLLMMMLFSKQAINPLISPKVIYFRLLSLISGGGLA